MNSPQPLLDLGVTLNGGAGKTFRPTMSVQRRLFHYFTRQLNSTHQIGQIGRMGQTLWIDQWGRVGRGVFNVHCATTQLLQCAHMIGETVATDSG